MYGNDGAGAGGAGAVVQQPQVVLPGMMPIQPRMPEQHPGISSNLYQPAAEVYAGTMAVHNAPPPVEEPNAKRTRKKDRKKGAVRTCSKCFRSDCPLRAPRPKKGSRCIKDVEKEREAAGKEAANKGDEEADNEES